MVLLLILCCLFSFELCSMEKELEKTPEQETGFVAFLKKISIPGVPGGGYTTLTAGSFLLGAVAGGVIKGVHKAVIYRRAENIKQAGSDTIEWHAALMELIAETSKSYPGFAAFWKKIESQVQENPFLLLDETHYVESLSVEQKNKLALILKEYVLAQFADEITEILKETPDLQVSKDPAEILSQMDAQLTDDQKTALQNVVNKINGLLLLPKMFLHAVVLHQDDDYINSPWYLSFQDFMKDKELKEPELYLNQAVRNPFILITFEEFINGLSRSERKTYGGILKSFLDQLFFSYLKKTLSDDQQKTLLITYKSKDMILEEPFCFSLEDNQKVRIGAFLMELKPYEAILSVLST